VLIATLLAVGLVGASGVAATARVHDGADRMLKGMRIDGVSVSGMTRRQALAVVQRDAARKLQNPVTVVANDRRFIVTPAQLGRVAELSETVDRALRGGRLPWIAKLWYRVSGQSTNHDFPMLYNDNSAQVASFVASVAGRADRTMQNAAIVLSNGRLDVRHARSGWSLDQPAGRSMVASALAAGHATSVTMPAEVMLPRVTDSQAGATITIDKSSNQLTLYNGLEVVKRYPVATAKSGFTTPSGTWKVVDKIVNPSWTNPAPNGWGAGMPLVIPPGPGNPLGTRALRLNSPGILIHGTFEAGSVGTYASHGCIRMSIADSVDLFQRVQVGTKVLVFLS
jgi:lipoprotein-anchoring transpeptidase ErfK/SrfK